MQYLPTQPPKRELLVRFPDGIYITTLMGELVDGCYYVGYTHARAETRSFFASQIVDLTP